MAKPDIEEADPIGGALPVAAELARVGLSPQQSVFLGYFVSFPDVDAAVLAAHRARSACWRTSVYRAATGRYMVRLSRQGRASLRRLRRDWDYMRGYASRNGGRWEAVVIEELAPDAYWETVAGRHIRRTAVRHFAVSADQPVGSETTEASAAG